MVGDLLDFGPQLDPSISVGQAPQRSASFEQRAAWSEPYVTWFIEQVDEQASWAADVSATHRYQVEFNSCAIDPEAYERQTRQELEARKPR